MKYYFKTHEWIEQISSNVFKMGISKYACDQLGDIVFIEAQDSGSEFEQGRSLAILESVKAVGDIYAPFNCKLLKTNPDLISSPESLNANTWQETWIVEIEGIETIELEKNKENLGLLDSDGYLRHLKEI